MKPRFAFGWLCASAPLLLGACSDPAQGGAFGVDRSAIVNGERSDTSEDGVVHVTSHPPGSEATSCTGTLIAPNVVITALHCVANYAAGTFSCGADGSLSTDHPGDGMIGALSAPDQIEIGTGVFPVNGEIDAVGSAVFGSGSSQICRNDIAIVVLDRNLDLPISAIRLENPMTRGEFIRVVGYGATEVSGSRGRFRRTGLQVADVGADNGASAMGTAAPRTFVVGQGPCFGDSGGPAFSEATGALTGVYSLVSAVNCQSLGVRNVYTHLVPFASLINQAFQQAGAEPILEPVDAGTGAGGSGAAGATGASGRPGGSGSRSDPSCACRAAGQHVPAQSGAALALGTLLALRTVRRVRRRARRRAQ